MILIDTHSHLDFPEFDGDRADVLKRARQAGLAFVINIGSSVESSRRSIRLAGENDMVYASVGIHPHYAKDVRGRLPDELIDMAGEEKVVAIGETGLDYYRNLSPKEDQRSLFMHSIGLAAERDLPIVVHAREAHEDTFAILRDTAAGGVKGVMHCFSGSDTDLSRYLKLGFFISFTCSLTFTNAEKTRALAGKVPPERLLLETDAPYMAPQEFRGRRNEPSYLGYLAEELGRIHGLTPDDIARITTHNAATLFGLPIEERPKIAYPIRDSLYINITNRCTNDCDFCVRASRDFVKGHNLKLDREPDVGDIIEAIGDPAAYKEIVFCGYGEPTLRLDVVKEVARYVKRKGLQTRMVTNGEGNLIHNRSIVRELAGLIDRVSVSLNVDSEDAYDKVCKSRFGPGVFHKVKEFAKECKSGGIEVELTFLNLPGVNPANCKRIAEEELEVRFRMRDLNVVG